MGTKTAAHSYCGLKGCHLSETTGFVEDEGREGYLLSLLNQATEEPEGLGAANRGSEVTIDRYQNGHLDCC